MSGWRLVRGGFAWGSIFVIVLVAVGISGCRTPDEPPVQKQYGRPLPEGAPALERVTDPAEMPNLRPAFAQREQVLEALGQSEIFFDAPSSRKWFPYSAPDREITHELMVETLSGLRRVLAAARNPDELNAWIRLAFDVYRSVGWDGSGEVLYTAYCEPIFEGRLEAVGEFRYPLFRLPEDLVKAEDGTPLGRRTDDGRIVPYWTRSEIESGNLLAGKELVYLRDPFEVYIAHVQGSARVNLPDGRQLCIGYAGKTDRGYTSIGLRLVEEGRISRDDLSLTTLKRYFKENPRELGRVLAINESYVFFLEREPGPFGSIGVKVTAYHSLATDKSIFPRGGPCVVVAALPMADEQGAVSRQPSTLLAFDQDTGGAIRSAGRGDLFIGTGPEAELLAGYTREEGRLYYLFLKEGALLPSEDASAPPR